MISIDITFKYSPIPVSVERKETEDGEKLYKQVVESLTSETPKLIELTCEKQPEKRVAFLSSQICAVVLSDKSGSTVSGRSPGFFSAAGE